jgi:hypothetical protein
MATTLIADLAHGRDVGQEVDPLLVVTARDFTAFAPTPYAMADVDMPARDVGQDRRRAL